jgi:signal transduction histidine kinase
MLRSLVFATVFLLIFTNLYSQKKHFDYQSLSLIPHKNLEVYLEKFSREKDTLGMAYVYKFMAERKDSEPNSKYVVVELSLKAIELFSKRDELQKNWQRIFLANRFSESYDGRQSLEYAQSLADSVLLFTEKVQDFKLKMSALQTIYRLGMVLENNQTTPKEALLACDILVKKNVISDIEQLKMYHYQKAYYALQEKNYDFSEQQFESSKIYALQKKDTIFSVICDLFITQIYRLSSRNNEALSILKNQLSKRNLRNNPDLEKWSYQEYALIYSNLGDFQQANKYWKFHFDKQNEILKLNSKNYRLGELINTMLVKNQKFENEKLQLVNALNAEKSRNYQGYIFILILLLIGVVIFMFARFKWNKLSNTNLKNAILLEGQELERSRFSKELHDGVGSSLAAIKTNLYFSEESKEKNHLLMLIDELYNQVRSISHQLYPSHLITDGLTVALRDYIHLLNQEGKIHYNFFGTEPKIESSKIINIFRISQELLNNAIRHAKAKNIELELMYQEKSIFIRVQDDGVGFQEKKEFDGIGLHNVRSRVDSINGQFECISELNKGTTFMISFEEL